MTRYGDGWSGYRAARAAARRGEEQRHQEYVDTLARTRQLVDTAGQRLSSTGKDPREGFGKHRRSHEAKLSGQVRAARRNLERLLREPVAARRSPCASPPGSTGTPRPSPRTPPTSRNWPASRSTGGCPSRTDRRPRRTAADLRPERRRQVDPAPRTRGRPHPRPRHRAAPHVRRIPPAGGRSGPGLRDAPARLRRRTPGDPDEHAEELLSLGLFREDDLRVRVAALSVGQRRRLDLARLVTRPAGLLVLDEPTNTWPRPSSRNWRRR